MFTKIFSYLLFYKIVPNFFNIISFNNSDKIKELYEKDNGRDFLNKLFLNLYLKEVFFIINNRYKYLSTKTCLNGIFRELCFGSTVFLLLFMSFIPIFFRILKGEQLVIAVSLISFFFIFLIYNFFFNFFINHLNDNFNNFLSTHSRLHKEMLEQLLNKKYKFKNEKNNISFFYCITHSFSPYSVKYFKLFKNSQKPYSFILKTFNFYHLNVYKNNLETLFPNYHKNFNRFKKENGGGKNNKNTFLIIFGGINYFSFMSLDSKYLIYIFPSAFIILSLIFLCRYILTFLKLKNDFIIKQFCNNPDLSNHFYSLHEKNIILTKSKINLETDKVHDEKISIKRRRL